MRPDCLPGGYDPKDIALPARVGATPEDGGPAYPASLGGPGGHQDSAGTWQFPGLTIRDQFAIAALQMLGAAAQDESVTSLEDRADDTARACYTIADAMLRARKS